MTIELPSLPNIPGSPRWVEVARDRERILLAALEDAQRQLAEARARIAELEADAERLNYIERTFAGCTTQDRYLQLRMIWGKGCNGRTLREACDKYMRRDATLGAAIDFLAERGAK